MKKISKFLIGILGVLFFVACEKNEDTDYTILKSGQIVIKAYPFTSGDKIIISFWILADKISIDWGDGTKEKFTNCCCTNAIYYFHEYPNNNFRTISILTESIASFSVANGYVHEMRIGECSKLEVLGCDSLSYYSNSLTVLGIDHCPALSYVRFGCTLSATALDSLFEMLPVNDNKYIKKTIVVGCNSGFNTCDTSIATSKGWTVYY